MLRLGPGCSDTVVIKAESIHETVSKAVDSIMLTPNC